jgi:predicted NBD/HSP70 family sugar kinase
MRRAEITERIGLSRSSAASLVALLADAGVLFETEAPATNEAGRPSSMVFPNEDIVALTAEIAVDRTRLALVGFGGRVLDRVEITIHSSEVAPSALLTAIGTRSQEVIDRSAGDLRVVGCCLAVHGTVDSDGRLLVAPNIGWATGTNLTAPWVDGVAVLAGNDASLGAIGEHRRGAGRSFNDLLYISSERGVGGGIVVNGELLTGFTGNVGEVGHMRVRPDGHPCGCGSNGCWETEVGTASFLRKAGSSDTVAATLQRAVDGDDPVAVAAALDVADWFGHGIASLINILGPRRVVVGGFLGDVLTAFPNQILDAGHRSVLGPHAPRLDLVRSELGHDAALIGAAEVAFATFLHHPTDD